MTRSETFKLRLTPQELAAYKAYAGAAGMATSDWMRWCCVNATMGLPVRERLPAPAAPDRDAPVRKARHGMCEHRRREDQYCSSCD